MKKQRKHYTPEEKVAILRRHLVEGVPISDLCDESGLQPTVFYRWQKEFFENGAAAFQQRARKTHKPEQERIAYLEKKIQTKDEVLAELMAEHVALKKTLGNSDRELGSARYAGSDRGFRPALVGEDRDRRRAVHWVARHHRQQVLRLAGTLREGERAQRLGSPRLLAGGLGEAGHHRLSSEEPAGGLPPAHVHDARRRHRGGESDQRMARVGAGRTFVQVERQAVEEGHGLRAPAGTASALAYRRVVHQHQWDVLLPVQHSGRLQPLRRELGFAGVDDRGGHRGHL